MFLKSLTNDGETIKFQYLNANLDTNTIVVSGKLGEIMKYLTNLSELYSQYLGAGAGLCKIAVAKDDNLNVVCTTQVVGGVSGSFSFQHKFSKASEHELNELEAQELYEIVSKYRTLNKVYDVVIELSNFLEENLLNVQGVEREQLELFEN